MPLPPPRKPNLPPPRQRLEVQPEPEEVPLEKLSPAERRERLREEALRPMRGPQFRMGEAQLPPPTAGMLLPPPPPKGRTNPLKIIGQFLLVFAVVVGLLLTLWTEPSEQHESEKFLGDSIRSWARVAAPPENSTNISYLPPSDTADAKYGYSFEAPDDTAIDNWIKASVGLEGAAPSIEKGFETYRIDVPEKANSDSRRAKVRIKRSAKSVYVSVDVNLPNTGPTVFKTMERLGGYGKPSEPGAKPEKGGGFEKLNND